MSITLEECSVKQVLNFLLTLYVGDDDSTTLADIHVKVP